MRRIRFLLSRRTKQVGKFAKLEQPMAEIYFIFFVAVRSNVPLCGLSDKACFLREYGVLLKVDMWQI